MRLLRTELPALAMLLAGCSETFWTSNVGETVGLRPNTALLTSADVRVVNRIEGFERYLAPMIDNTTQNIILDANKVPIKAIHYRSRQ